MSSNFLPAGARDLLPTDLIRQEKIRHTFLEIFKSWGYQPVLPPTLESLEAIDKGRPQFLNECFKVIDRDGKLLALRPDLTLPIARLAATRLKAVERPLRLCYLAKVFRQEIRLADEKREIYQAGIELIGSTSIDQSSENQNNENSQNLVDKANLECLSILLETLAKSGLTDYQIVLSHTDLWKYAGEIFHKVEEQLGTDLSEELNTLIEEGDFVKYQQAVTNAEKKCIESLSKEKGSSELKSCFESKSPESPLQYLKRACYNLTGKPREILDYLDSDSNLYKELFAIIALEEIFGPDKFIIDFTIRPDPHYYTGLYFEVVIPASGKPVGRGGRYNNLTACFGNPESAIGFTLHVDSILKYAVHDTTKDPENKEEKKVMIPLQEDLIKSLRESMELRKKHPIVILK